MVKKIKFFIADKDNLTLWMNNLFVLYVFLIPISQTIKATVFTLVIILFLLRGNVVFYIKEAFKNKVVQAFVWLFLIYVLGLAWSENIKEGLYWVKSIKYGLYLIIFYTIVDGRYIARIVSAFILGMLVSELVSYGMLFGIMPWELKLFGIKFYTTQVVGDPSPFLNHIHYGVLLAFVVMLLGQKIVYSNSIKVMKIFMSLFVLSATANIFITGGRTGYVTFFLLLFVLGISYLKKYFIALVLAGSLVFVMAYNFSSVFKENIVQTQNSLEKVFSESNFETSLGVRVGMYYYGYEAVKDSILFGVGSGDSMDRIYHISPENWRGQELPHEHNQFLSIFVKLGIIGLLIFLNIYYQIFRYKQEDKELKYIMLVSTLAIAFGILTTQFNLRVFLPLWVSMLAISMISKNRKTIQNIDLNDKTQLIQIISVGILLSIYILSKQLF